MMQAEVWGASEGNAATNVSSSPSVTEPISLAGSRSRVSSRMESRKCQRNALPVKDVILERPNGSRTEESSQAYYSLSRALPGPRGRVASTIWLPRFHQIIRALGHAVAET